MEQIEFKKTYFVLQEIKKPVKVHDPGLFEITVSTVFWTFVIVGILLSAHIVVY